MESDDTELLRRLRNMVCYHGYKNSLIEWTLSDSWLSVTEVSGPQLPVSGEISGR